MELTEWAAHAVVETFSFDPVGEIRITFSEFRVIKSWANLSNGIWARCESCDELLVSSMEVSYFLFGSWFRMTPILET